MQPLLDILETSMKDKKGVNFYIHGQTVGGLVLKIHTEFVEVRNQANPRIVIRLDRIDAAALS